jgi:hypothetical protein
MWTRKDYEKNAAEIASSFVDSKGAQTINKLATDVARDNNLNPDGIRTLVRLANVDAFTGYFAKAAGDDRIVEFETGDPEIVIQSLHNEAEEKIASASPIGEYDRYVDYWVDPPKPVEFEEEKVASVEETPEVVPSKEEVRFLLKRAEDEYDMCVRRTEIEWEDLLQKSAQSSRTLGSTAEGDLLEKNALAVKGATILPELQMLARMTGREYTLTSEKTASILDTHLAVPRATHRPIIEMLEKASAVRAKRSECKKCLEYVRTKIAELK